MRANYWSTGKFANWVRGTKYPEYDSSEGWDAISKIAKAAHPVRYWIAETLIDKIQDFVMFPQDKYYDFKYYLDNRFITKTNALTAHPNDINPGSWCDLGERFLPCMFNELVNYVEVELAWSYIKWETDDEQAKKYNYSKGTFGHNRNWRCKQAGLDYLKWASSLTYDDHERSNFLTPQALKAIEITMLYTWWTEKYPNRPDPGEVSGVDAFYKDDTSDGNFFKKRSAEDQALLDSLRKTEEEIETQYRNEDTEMMIRLIKIRDGLWT